MAKLCSYLHPDVDTLSPSYSIYSSKNLMQYEPINPSSKLHRKKEKRWERAQRDDFKKNFLSKYEVFSRP